MKFALIDRILELDERHIVAVKSPTLSEDYMHDHFPSFPVMPGVLMLESMYQASAWLVRQAEDFSHSMVLMKEARNVKYSGLVKPGEQLRVEATLLGGDDRESKLKVACTVNDQTVASGRLTLERFNLADRDPEYQETDTEIRRQLHVDFQLLMPAKANVV